MNCRVSVFVSPVQYQPVSSRWVADWLQSKPMEKAPVVNPFGPDLRGYAVM
jgi:hypothetical protein